MSSQLSPQAAPTDTLAGHQNDVVPDLPPSENKLFYPALDGLRAIAVLLVFLEHYELVNFRAYNWGWIGVDIFFVLSGFLITGILYDTRNTAHRFRNFYARRTLRIFPLYYGVLLFGLLLTPIFHFLWNPAWILWFFYLGNYARFIYLHSPLFPMGAIEHLVATRHNLRNHGLYLGHFWSLCVEEQFYLVWPFVVFAIRDRVRLRNLCAIVCCVVLLARIACVFLVPQPYLAAELLYRVTPLRVDALLLGGFVALCLRGSQAEANAILRVGKLIVPVFAVGFVLWELLYKLLSGTHHIYLTVSDEPFLITVGYTLIDIFAAGLVLSMLQPRGPIFHFFNLKWLRRLGQISYGFYVFHDMFHDIWRFPFSNNARLHRVHLAHASGTGLALVGTIAISYLSYRYFETPFLRLKDRFTAS